MAVQQLYTPFLADIGKEIGRYRTRAKEKEEEKARNQLIRSAYMGDKVAIEQLAQVDPQSAAKIESQQKQQAQIELQTKQSQEDRSREILMQNRELVQQTYKEIAKLKSVEEAQAHIDRTVAQNQELFKGVEIPRLTPEAFHQIKLIHRKAEKPKEPKEAAGLRKDFMSATKEYAKVNDATGRIIASAKDPSAAGDLALIFNYMKILDPGSTVRESEFATAQNAAGVPERVRAWFNNIRRGERLTEEQRKDFIDRGLGLYEEARRIHQGREKEWSRIAKRAGVDPQDVIIERSFITDEMIDEARGGSSAKPEGSAESAQAKSPEGLKPGDIKQGYRFKGGNPADPNRWEKQ